MASRCRRASLQSAAVTAGLRLMLMARNNEILAEARTGDDGLARFPAALMRGTGPLAPVAVHAETADDLAALSLEAASFDLSDRGATGLPQPGPVDAFLWLDRGIFRPGETVNVAALIRDPAGRPLDLPVRLRLRRPNGQVAAEYVPPRQDGGAIYWPMRLSAGATFGVWSLEALTDPDAPPVGRTTFRVEAFLPERLAVEAGPVPGPLVPGQQPAGAGHRALPLWRARRGPDRPGRDAPADRPGALPRLARLALRPRPGTIRPRPADLRNPGDRRRRAAPR